MILLQLVVNGLALGAAYALVALGFVFIVNATSAVNFAHGDLVMAGGYVAVGLGAAAGSIPVIVLLPLVAAIMFAIGVAVSLVAYFPLTNRPPSTVFISTLLCGIILQNLFLVLFGPQARAAPPLIKSGIVHLGGIEISIQALGTLAVAAVLIVLQYFIFARTQIGRRLRATAQDRQMAQAIGIRTSAVIAATFGFGTALAGVAGALLANQFFVYPTGGIPLSVYAYIAVVVGGWGSIPGAVIGAMMISVFQVVVSAYVSYAMATGLLYVALLLIFLFRPQGIFGELVQRRV
jgi:branched-chain amino acid transport system permease protein